jgi:hypothetical protein
MKKPQMTVSTSLVLSKSDYRRAIDYYASILIPKVANRLFTLQNRYGLLAVLPPTPHPPAF